VQVPTSRKRQNEINRQQLNKIDLDKFAHFILIKVALAHPAQAAGYSTE
jgi:hypothetical protein